MASIIDSEDSEQSDWFIIPVPPRYDDHIHPTVDTTEDGNNSIAVTVNTHHINNNCEVSQDILIITIHDELHAKVEEYNIKYGDEELIVAADSLEDEKIIMQKKGDGEEVKGRIRYQGYEEWSSWGKALQPVILPSSSSTFTFISTALISISPATH